MNTIQNAQAPQAPQVQREVIGFDAFGEIARRPVTATWMPHYRPNCPVKGEDGKPVVDEKGQAVMQPKFKMSTPARFGDKIVYKVAWVPATEAEAAGVKDGVPVKLTIEVNDTGLVASDKNGKPNPTTGRIGADEYLYDHPSIVAQ